jgi:hypothetical protein
MSDAEIFFNMFMGGLITLIPVALMFIVAVAVMTWISDHTDITHVGLVATALMLVAVILTSVVVGYVTVLWGGDEGWMDRHFPLEEENGE